MSDERFTELSDSVRTALRAKAIRNGTACCEHLSDEWVANEVRMLMRDDLAHEAICMAGRDRIMKLSLRVAELQRFERMYQEATKVVGDEEVLLYVKSGNAIPVTRCTVSADLIRQLVDARRTHEAEAPLAWVKPAIGGGHLFSIGPERPSDGEWKPLYERPASAQPLEADACEDCRGTGVTLVSVNTHSGTKVFQKCPACEWYKQRASQSAAGVAP